VPIASIATVFTDTNGNRILLVVHQALYLGDKHTGCLVNPNQLRSYGLAVHDCPSQFDLLSRHSIYSPQSNMHIPLQLDGITLFFESVQPIDQDMVSLPHVVLTSADEWDPYSTTFTKKEEVARRCAVVAKEQSNRLRLQEKIAKDLRDLQPLHPMDFNFNSIMEVRAWCVLLIQCYEYYVHIDSMDLSGENLCDSLVKCIRVAPDDMDGNILEGGNDKDVYERRNILRMQSKDKQSVLTPEILARKWGIGIETADRTLEVTNGEVKHAL
jgi:hypothetical protein